MTKKSLILCAAFAIVLALFFSACKHSSGSAEDDLTTETNLSTAFDNILNNKKWTVGNPTAITEKDRVYTFNGRQSIGSIKRTLVLNDQTTLKFSIFVFLYTQYDGYFEFLIDNKVVKTYTGLTNSWQNEVFELNAGKHTIEWRHNDPNTSQASYWQNDSSKTVYVSLKDFSLKKITALTTLNQTFDEALDSDMWICSGLYADVVEEEGRWPQSGDALVDTHGKVLQLATFTGSGNTSKYGDSSLKIYKINVAQESALSFDYKCDLAKGTYKDKEYKPTFKVFIDDATEAVFEESGYGQLWKNASITLSPGIHSVKFSVITDSGYHFDSISNSVFIDNISLAPDKIDSVDIYPKGLQETYVGGFPIQFSAKALRSDGSVISGKSISWSATGGTIDNDGNFAPGATAGTFTVTATIDGMATSNQTVKIHGDNYIADSVTINGHTFTGEITEGTGYLNDTVNITFAEPTPRYSHFTADGFFPLKGSANDTDVLVIVIKRDEETEKKAIEEIKKTKKFGEYFDYDNYDYNNLHFSYFYNWEYKYRTQYLIKKGDFNQRIWLRFGDGEYEIWIYEANISGQEDYDGYEGALNNWNYSGEVDTTANMAVINKTGLDWTSDDCAFLMPSFICQSDDYLVSNGFNACMAELPQNASVGKKLQVLYDWVINLCHYDFISSGEPPEYKDGLRKRQDAMHVVKYGMAVCEGYANLYTALARLAGVKSAYQSSNQLNHAWTECYYKGEWKMVDATWDDPSDTTVTVSIPNAGNYNYFLINRQDSSHAGEDGTFDNVTDYSRTVTVDEKTDSTNYMPDCRF